MSKKNLFTFVSERYPMCSQVITDNEFPEFDNFYLDVNGIIRNCSINANENAHLHIMERQICVDVFNYIDNLFSMIKPRRLLFLAIDGVTPRAEMHYQQSLRFLTARDAEETKQNDLSKREKLSEDKSDLNRITAGTIFMEKLTKTLGFFIAQKITEDSNWRGIDVFLAGPEMPGTAESKILDYIRLTKADSAYNPNVRECLYSSDPDSFILGLITHDPNFAFLCEEVSFYSNRKQYETFGSQSFRLMHLSLLREYFQKDFGYLKNKLKFKYDVERILDDFVLLALLVGNKFLPTIDIDDRALEIALKVYKKVLPECKGYIQEDGKVDLSRLQKNLDCIYAEIKTGYVDPLYIASNFTITSKQHQILQQIKEYFQSNNTNRNPKFRFNFWIEPHHKRFLNELFKDLGISPRFEFDYNPREKSTSLTLHLGKERNDMRRNNDVWEKYSNVEVIKENMSSEDIEKYEAKLQQLKSDYYFNKVNIDINDEEQMDDLVGSYIIGIQWVLKYYYDGVPSWRWFYPYHYAPKISDFKDIVRFQDENFTLGEPFKPFEHLMGVLPRSSRKLLPTAYQDLMTDKASPIIDYYPCYYDVDTNSISNNWKPIVKIPFIDEKLLLDAINGREQHLTEDEKARNCSGTMFKYSTSDNLSVYSSPFPGVIPDIDSFAHKEICRRPNFVTEGLILKKGLLPGAKVGKNALAGFPSLEAIPHTFEFKYHRTQVFEQENNRRSVVISIKNEYQHLDIEEIVKQFLYNHVYVHYPYLQQAVVIGISNEEKACYVNFNNGKKQVGEHYWDDEEKKGWANRMDEAKSKLTKRFALVVGDIKVCLHVCVFDGMRQTEDRDLVKSFVRPRMQELIPIQMVVTKVENPDHRFIEKPAPPIQEALPLESKVFFLGRNFSVAQATVIGHSNGNVDIEVIVPAQDQQQREPKFGHEAVRKQENDMRYESGHNVARKLGISSAALSLITSSLNFNDKSGQRINVGLNLKLESKGEKVLGLTRKHPNGYWEYSRAAVALIREYCEKFPRFVKSLEKKQGGRLDVSYFDWTPNGQKALYEMNDWIKSKKLDSLTRASLADEKLGDVYCQEIEKAATKYHEAYEKLDFEKLVYCNIPRMALLRPADTQFHLSRQKFSLGDRVIYAWYSGSVPFGNKGTVVGVKEKVIDVVFDTTFVSGTTLGGRCQDFRGSTLPYSYLINLSSH
ncbi:exonuclease II Exo2 [Mucor circinelloides]